MYKTRDTKLFFHIINKVTSPLFHRPVSANGHNFDVASGLFDEGAQRSSITHDLPEKLKMKPHGTEILKIFGFGK